MKIQIDTTEKVIRIEEKVNLMELFNQVQTLLPGGKWEEYDLEVTTTQNGVYPIVIQDPTPFPETWRYVTTLG